VSKRVSYEWEKLYPDFLHTLENIDAMQERTAVNRGLDGTFNAAITKLILHNHGYSEKSELSHTSPDGSMTPNKGLDTSKLSTEALAEIMALSDANQKP
jgi:hypothetical protein